jgi:hypothetical protein
MRTDNTALGAARWIVSAVAPLFVITLAFTISDAAFAACSGPGAPSTTQTKCLTAITIPGNALRSFDISFVNPDRAELYLADRSNSGIDVIDTRLNKWKRTITGFVGIKNTATGAVDSNHSGPDGVVSHGKWLYAGDGDSTLKVIDLDAPTASAIKQTLNTGGTTRVDEMDLTTDGKKLLAANNAEDPPFGTLFNANGDNFTSNVTKITKITVDPAIMPTGFGLSIEQPAWDSKTERFYVSIPVIADNPKDCNYGQLAGKITCHGGMLVIDPAGLTGPTTVIGAFDKSSNTGVVKLNECGPNGATVGPHDNLLLGCTPQNNPSDTSTLVINAKTKDFANIGGITGSDEVWFNSGDNRYYTGSSRDLPADGVTSCVAATAPVACPALGVINAETNLLIEKIPQGTGSHSLAADSRRNRIYVPQVGTVAVVGIGGDLSLDKVSSLICGGNNGCIAVYQHDVDEDEGEGDKDHHHDR